MWRAIGGTAQGNSHIKTGTPCQDKIFTLNRNEDIVVALADGAGSARLSHFGAECTTKVICDYLNSNFDRLFTEEDGIAVKRELLDAILSELDIRCEELECERKDLASTILAIAIINEKFILVHLGDGVIGYLVGKELKVASTPENGEFVNETVFTTSSNALSSIQIKKGEIKNIIGFILMSDGPEVSLYNKRDKQLINGIKNVMLSCSLLPFEEAQRNIQNNIDSVLKNRTADDCSLQIVVNKERVIEQLLSEDEFFKKVCGISPRNTSPKRLAFYLDLISYLADGKDTNQITKHFHIDKKVLKKRLRSLEHYGIVQSNNGKYYSTITL